MVKFIIDFSKTFNIYELYCVSSSTFYKIIRTQIEIQKKINWNDDNLKKVFEMLGKPCKDYPTALLKSDIANAYSFSLERLNLYIKTEQGFDKEFKEYSTKNRIFFPAHLKKIEQILGKPNISFSVFSEKRKQKY